jgi:hypothetical protein
MKAKEFIIELKKQSKHRNFVAKNASLAGKAGQHKDKKKAEKQGDVKHKKELATMESALSELSTEKLAQYKKAAGADAKKADADGNYSQGDKRFKGINRATNKQFDNDLKKRDVAEAGAARAAPGVVKKGGTLDLSKKVSPQPVAKPAAAPATQPVTPPPPPSKPGATAPPPAAAGNPQPVAKPAAAPAAKEPIVQATDDMEQRMLDRMGKRFGLPPGSSADDVQAAQQAYLDKNDPAAAAQYKKNMTNIDAGGAQADNQPVKLAPKPGQPGGAPNPDADGGQAAAKAGKSPIAIMLAQPTIGKNQAMLDVIAPTLGLPAGSSAEQILAADDARNAKAKNKYAPAAAPAVESAGRAVDAKGRTQQEWVRLVKAKFPDAKLIQAKMIDGPIQAILPDGRKLSWNKVDKDVAEASLGNYREKALKQKAQSQMGAMFNDPDALATFNKRERGLNRLKARDEVARKTTADKQMADNIAKLPELKANYERMKAEYKSLGGSNWQYADREQNLTDRERKARGMEGPMNNLWRTISAAEKAQKSQGVEETSNMPFAGAKVGHKEGSAGQWRNDGAKKNRAAKPGDLVGGGM